MTIKEFRKAIIETQNPDWFNNQEIELSFPSVDFKNTFTGLPSFANYLYGQLEKYQKLEIPENSNLKKSHRFFESAIAVTEGFLRDKTIIEDSSTLDAYWLQVSGNFQQNGNKLIFPADSVETEFILSLEAFNTNTAMGAFRYLTKSNDSNFSSFDVLNGYLLAYELRMRDHRTIKDLIAKERKTISNLKNEFAKAIPQSEYDLNEHLIKTEASVKGYFNEVEAYKTDKEKLFADWFINTKGDFESFNTYSESKISELEETYNQKLKLEEPALYWKERGNDLKKQGHWMLGITLILVLISVASLASILFKTPTDLYSSFFSGDKSAAIRWSIIYITILSFIAFTVKQLSKVMFSSYHLARDCQERYTLTYFYLSLLKNSAVAPEQQQLIIQSLFSRAESGLLKDDGSPTMPTDIVQSVLKNK
ncbi:DUF6161 domain-containing protein [Pedobacter sp. SG908]|uniref:DUF6161 domain-containing protein n=1 Tax=Pedobacter sp. SG908 TaxID=2587135 RepID=UPI0014227D89|nr:DUF6161 domain-containing protein [Pedobacter sp. SG908]NII81197.1 hypothetical protein [Pedobacter sp. SG908]